ncbi:hypothetical protein [Microbacterium sp. 77mftsu3.1]|uniref:hypothetical protein n=1 Tax=Microbacterium sp. 77mftsu3.1 TaxID=1761802 RepID=UPI00039B8A19|nr:hypothetical protein [Microbacterium sp. 77mftsu3.1]SDH49324.1 hypothetical protein SAMN04488590_3435 [Microbacterium sp. 77mftsu3.1]
MTRRLILVWLVCLAFAGGTYMVCVPQPTADAELRKAQAEFRAAGIDASLAVMERDEALEERDELAEAVSAYSAVLEAQEVFTAAASKAQAALDSAKGKVDVSALRKRAQTAQAKAFGVKRDASIVLAQKVILDELTTEVTSVVAAHEKKVTEEAARKAAAARESSSSSKGWLSDARRTLDSYGGSWVKLRSYDGNCGGSFHIGCNFSATDIGIHSSWATKGASYRNWVIMHELAHSYQRKAWGAIHASPTYKRLFNGEIELLANCMAKHRGQGWGGNRCTPERTAWAAGIWAGNVRG